MLKTNTFLTTPINREKRDGNVFVDGKQLSDDEIRALFPMEKNVAPEGATMKEIPAETGATPPANVPDERKACTWFAAKGLKETTLKR